MPAIAAMEGCQIFPHRSACRLRITILVPIFAWHRTFLVGAAANQAGINRKTFAADKPCCDARRHHALEYAPKNITLAKPLVARTRERRVIRDLVLQAQAAEPAIG